MRIDTSQYTVAYFVFTRCIDVWQYSRLKLNHHIHGGAVGPALLMRAVLIEHPASYLCLHQAGSRLTLHKYYITTEPIC